MNVITKQKKTEEEKALDRAASEEIKRHIKAEMSQRGLTAKVVAERLTKMGRQITEQGLRNKISTSSHQTVWFWDLMKAIREE